MKENVKIVEPHHMKMNESADHQIISDMTYQLGAEQSCSYEAPRIGHSLIDSKKTPPLLRRDFSGNTLNQMLKIFMSIS